MTTITRIGTTQRWSDVVIHNGTLYVVEVPVSEEADIHQQTREVLAEPATPAGSQRLRRRQDPDGQYLSQRHSGHRCLQRAVGCLDPGWHRTRARLRTSPASPTKATRSKCS